MKFEILLLCDTPVHTADRDSTDGNGGPRAFVKLCFVEVGSTTVKMERNHLTGTSDHRKNGRPVSIRCRRCVSHKTGTLLVLFVTVVFFVGEEIVFVRFQAVGVVVAWF